MTPQSHRISTEAQRPTSGQLTDIDDKKQEFDVVDEISHRQSDYPDKMFYLRKVQFRHDHRIEFRLCYWIKGKKPKAAGKWVFGQYAPFMPAEDSQAIIGTAIEKGWVSEGDEV